MDVFILFASAFLTTFIVFIVEKNNTKTTVLEVLLSVTLFGTIESFLFIQLGLPGIFYGIGLWVASGTVLYGVIVILFPVDVREGPFKAFLACIATGLAACFSLAHDWLTECKSS